MPILSLLSQFKSEGKFSQNRTTHNVCSEQQFRRIIEVERARVDRSGYCFSVVSFDTGKSKENGQLRRNLLKVLDKRVRSTDQAGWIDKKRLGVLLHNTSAEAALGFTRHIRREIAMEISPPEYDIYTYPTNKSYPGSEKTNSNKNNETHTSGKGDGSTAEDFLSVSKPSPEIRETNSHHSTHGAIDESKKEVQGIHPLVCQRIPVWKRCLDIVGSLIGLTFLSPLFLFIAIFIKTVSPGPVFFKQERVGCGGKKFTFWKFRTMTHNMDTKMHQQYLATLIKQSEDMPMAKLDEKLQVIPCGNWLRKSCLDELPQLFNVLLGDMSLVGPRPPIPYEVDEYKDWHSERLDTVPGMTGLWQISGKNRLTFLEMVRLDIRYIRQLAFWSEIKILLMTPIAIVLQAVNNEQKK